MTVPTRQPTTSRPYPVAEPPTAGPGSSANGWVTVIIAGVVAAFVIAFAGVIAGLVVLDIRESAPRPTPAAAATTTVPQVAAIAERGLDAFTVQLDVARALGETYGLDDVGEVTCPDQQPARAGTVFECDALIAGIGRAVSVTVIGDDGAYEIGRPH